MPFDRTGISVDFVMDPGVLETSLTLGFVKVVCSLLYFPCLRNSLNSVSFCCSCLLIFTDLAVTVFLTILWLAKPWQPQSFAPCNVIVPRLLLFLDHTYGAVMLLTTPLVAVDTACRLWWPLDSERWGEGGVDRGRGCYDVGDPIPPDIKLGQHQSTAVQGGSVLHLPGFLCCLLLWSLCGCSAEGAWRSEGGLLEACLQAGAPLTACLPDLPTVALQTLGSLPRTLASAALSLLLALSMGVLRGGWAWGRKEGTEDHRSVRTRPAVPTSLHCGVKTPETNGASITWDEAVQDRRTPPISPAMLPRTGQSLLSNTTMQGLCNASESAGPPFIWDGSCVVTVLLAIPKMGSASSGGPYISPHRPIRFTAAAALYTEPSPRRVQISGGMLIGLACGAAFCLLPPAIAVNAMAIRTVERLTEWSLRCVLSASRGDERE
ncbi:hypothetical protein GJAV_G00188220 [Gymnothorax javanicus]|nr:hypothetical protein GJAV_G00188220 [Gymnothorax javanicus]